MHPARRPRVAGRLLQPRVTVRQSATSRIRRRGNLVPSGAPGIGGGADGSEQQDGNGPRRAEGRLLAPWDGPGAAGTGTGHPRFPSRSRAHPPARPGQKTGTPSRTSRQSSEAKSAGSMTPFSFTQAIIVLRISSELVHSTGADATCGKLPPPLAR